MNQFNNPYKPYQSGGYQQPYYGGAGPMQPAVPPQVPPTGTVPSTTYIPPVGVPTGPPTSAVPGMLPIEQSYIENILRLNKGKLATVYATFEGNSQWNAKKFVGIIEAAGRDHLILSDPETGQRVLLPMVYLDYVTFAEELEYEYPFAAGPGISTYPPR